MKKIPNWLIIVLLLALLIVLKLVFLPKEEGGAGSKAGGSKEAAPIAVNYMVVKPGTFENDVFTAGKIGAFNEVDLVPEVNGKVAAIYFKEGQPVEKGMLLVKLNDADLQAQLLKIKSQIGLALQKLNRLEQLLKINGISKEDFEMQQTELESLKADEAYTSALLAKTSIVAPFSGQAGLKNISVGSYVSASTPVVSLVQMKPVFVEFSVPEKYTDNLTIDDEITFKVNKSENANSASIYAVEPKVDEITRSVRVRAEYKGNGTFYPGSFVNVYVDLGKSDTALMLPTQAIVSILKGHKVYVAKAGKALEVPVKIGMRTPTTVQVIEGLQSGDTVLTTGLLSLRKESKIKLLKAN